MGKAGASSPPPAATLPEAFTRDLSVFRLSGEMFQLTLGHAYSELATSAAAPKGKRQKFSAAAEKSRAELDSLLGALLREHGREVVAAFLGSDGASANPSEGSRRLRESLQAKGVSSELLGELLGRERDLLYAQRRLAATVGLKEAQALPPVFQQLLEQGELGDWKSANWGLDRDLFLRKYREQMAQDLDSLLTQTQRDSKVK